MAIEYGDVDNNLRVGIDVEVVTMSATTVTVRFKFYADPEPDSWGWNDGMTLRISGSVGTSSVNFHKSATNNQLVATRTLSATRRLGGGPAWNVYCSISGAFNGASPYASRQYVVPAKAASPPAPPVSSSIRFEDLDSDSVRIFWGLTMDSNGDAVDEYHVQVSRSNQFGSISHQNTSPDRDDFASGLTRATDYFVRVRCHNSAGWGNWSGAKSFTTHATVPSVVPRDAPSLITTDTARLSWSAPSDNGGRPVGDYRVQYRRTTVSDWATRFTEDLHYDLTSLIPGSEYEWKVQARNAVGSSPLQADGFNFTTLVGTPAAPARPDVDSVQPTQARVTWATPSANGGTIEGYQVQRSTTSSFTGATTYTVGLVNNYTMGPLAAATFYYVRVRAVGDTGFGAWSPVKSFSTSGVPVPYPVVKYWNGTTWVRMEPISEWDGTDFVEIAGIKYWNGSTFVDIAAEPY